MSKIKTILAFAALMLCGAAWAIPSYVVWDQDFSQLTKNGVTLSINGNNVGNDDPTCLKITNDSTADAPQGLTLMGGFSSTKLTVVVAYKNLTLDSNYKTLVTVDNASDVDAAGVAVSLGETRGVYRSGYYNGTHPGLEAVGEDDTEQVIAYVQDNQDRTGAKAYARNSDGSWTQFLNQSSLTYTGKSIGRIAIGGVALKGANFASTPAVPATDMVVTRIAVVTDELTADQLAEFDWTYTTEIFEGKLPTESDCERFVSSDWRGMVWIKDYGVTKFQNGYEIVNSKLDNLSRYGNENSTVKFSGVRAYTPQETVECPYELILDNDKYQYAWKNDSGWSSGARYTFAKLSGSGKFLDAYPICTQPLVFTDWSAFTGSFDIKGKRITLGGTEDATTASGQIAIAGEDPATIAANTSWAAAGGILANGSLQVPSTAPQRWLSESLHIAADGVVTVDRTDWINYSVTADKTIDVRGTLDLGTKRQTLGAKNIVRIYPGALIKGSEAADGGCHLNFYKLNAASSYCKLSMVPDGEKTDEAEISAVIGPQEAELTIDVAQNLTLNLSAAASCSFPTRQKGLIKTGEGVLKVTGHYDTLASLTLNGGTIEVYDGAKIPATVDTTVPDMRVAEETSGGKTTYTLVEKSVVEVAVTVQPCEGTTIAGVESGMACEGDTLSFTVAVADGYNADSLVVKNGEDTLEADDAGVYSVVVGTEDVTITTEVEASDIEFTITAAEGVTVEWSVDGGATWTAYAPGAKAPAGEIQIRLTSAEGAVKVVTKTLSADNHAFDVTGKPREVYATGKALDRFVLENGDETQLEEGDTIVCANWTSDEDRWRHGPNISAFADHLIVLRQEMDCGADDGIPANGRVEIDFVSHGKGVYLYGDIGENARVGGGGTIMLGYIGNACTINDGVKISANVSFQDRIKTVTINGAVEITGDVDATYGLFKLADGAELTVAKLDDGKVETDVAGKKVVYADGRYMLVSVVTVTPQPEAGSTAKVYQDGVEVTGSPVKVERDSAVDVVFTANAGYCFADFTSVKTNTVTAAEDPTVVVGPTVVAGQSAGETAYAVTKDGVCKIFGTGVATELPTGIDRSSVKSVEVADGVTEIGQRFFKDCRRMNTLRCGKDVVKFGEKAFYLCLSLESIEIANPNFDMDSLANAIVYQAAIDENGKVYTIPRISAEGYEEVLYGKANLTDGEWRKIGPAGSVTMEESGCHFFHIRLEKVAK